MDNKAKFYKNAEKVLNFIYVSRFRYVHIYEIEQEFLLFFDLKMSVNIVKYLRDKNYIDLDGVLSKITYKGIKHLLNSV